MTTPMDIINERSYSSLQKVLDAALSQAKDGKGKERHATIGELFENQPICEIGRRVGPGYQLGQAVKKIYESQRLPKEEAVAELLGAINYLAAAVIVRRETPQFETPPLPKFNSAPMPYDVKKMSGE